MLPIILALAGGYLILDSQKEKLKFEDGGKMAKGGIYSSDDRWKVTFQNQDSAEFETIVVRANNKKNAIAIAEDESGLSSEWEYYSAEKEMADGGKMAKGGKLDSGVYRVGKPKKVSPNLYEQKIVEIFDNGDIATASDYGRKLSDFSSQKYPIISKEKLDAQYKMADGGGISANEKYVVYGVTKVDKEVKILKEATSYKLADSWLQRYIDKGLDEEFEKMGYMPKVKFEKEKSYLKD
jgi:hypothetical protein